MINHNFILGPTDTDSISFCKEDMSEFTDEEKKNLLLEINSFMPKLIQFADDGYYECCIALKTKNYVLKKYGKKPVYKGSTFKNQNKEPRLRDFMHDIVKEIGIGREEYVKVYNNYVKEIMNIKDINGWCTKKTITEAVLENERTNELKVRDAIAGTEYKEADKIWVFFDEDNSLKLKEKFNGTYSKTKLLEKLYKTVIIFDKIIDKSIFLNYNLKRNKNLLDKLLNE